MKVLIIGIDFFTYTNSLKEAFKERNCLVRSYELKFGWGLLGKAHAWLYTFFHKRITKKNYIYCPPKFVLGKQNKEILKICTVFQPDLVVSFPGYGLSKKVLQRIGHIKSIIWVYDCIDRLPFLRSVLGLYHAIFTFEKTDIEKYKRIGFSASFLPLCADEKTNFPLSVEKDIDLLFIGNLTQERILTIAAIRESFPTINMVVFGKYSPELKRIGNLKPVLEKHDDIFVNRIINQKEGNEYYSRSKICINMHHKQTKYGANMRFFEILASNSFQLVDYNEYIRDYFGDCVATYHNKEELIDKIGFYLRNEEERLKVAQRGYKKVLEIGTFKNRVDRILVSAMEEGRL